MPGMTHALYNFCCPIHLHNHCSLRHYSSYKWIFHLDSNSLFFWTDPAITGIISMAGAKPMAKIYMKLLKVIVCLWMLWLFQTKEELELQCNQVIMLITCDASADYSDVFNQYNWPGREVGIFYDICFYCSSRTPHYSLYLVCTSIHVFCALCLPIFENEKFHELTQRTVLRSKG